MAAWLQHLLVLMLVGACATYSLWGAAKTLWGKRSRMGSCCAKGCSTVQGAAKLQAAEKIHFLPVEMLGRKSR